jgi:hypothetical protein
MWRFRISDMKTDPPSVKEAWLAPPTIKKDGASWGFHIRITDDPKEALIAETESQAFFMFVSVKDSLENLGVGIAVEPAS